MMKKFAVSKQKGIFVIIASVVFVLAVTMLFLVAGSDSLQANAASSNVTSYGFFVDSNLVTSDNLSGEGWSYDPKTQVLTLGEEGKSFAFTDRVSHAGSFNGMHTVDGKVLHYASLIQPETSIWDYQGEKETYQFLTNANRPQKLKIVVKGDVQLGNSDWPACRYDTQTYGSNGDTNELYNVYGGIMWNGEIEISGGGNLQIRSHAYGINSKENKITFTDVTVGVESYGNCMMVGEMVLTNANVTNTSNSIGGYGRDEATGNVIKDSATVVSAHTITMKGSHLNAVGTYNRNNTTEPGNGMQDFTALSSRPIYLYDSTVEAKAFIGSGWTLYCKDASGNDLGNNLWIRAILSSLHLYDGSYVTATAGENGDAVGYDDRERVDFVGINGSIYAYGNAGVCGNVYEGSHAASSAILGIKWDANQDKLVVPNGKITNDHTEYEIDSYYLNTSDPYYQSKNRYLSQYSVNIKFWKQDTLYLRYGENDQPQASWHRNFSSIINLSSTTVNTADYLAYDGKPCSVAVMSGVFTVMLPQNPDVERYYIAQGGHLKLQMKDGANYGTVHVKSSEYYGITIEGNGTIEYLDCEESKYAFTRSISLITVPYICGGSLTINGGNIKKCKVDGGYNNRININDGNVILEGGNLTKHVLDFNKIDGTVDLKNGGLSLRNLYISFNNLELLDGVYYFYTRDDNNLGGLFNYVYVQSEDSYNYYMLPVRESKVGNTVTYNFQRFEEKWLYEPGNSTTSKNKKIYARVGESVTLEAGQFVKYVVIEPAVLFGFNGLTARLGGSEFREVPSGATIQWYVTDTRTGTTNLVKQYGTLDYTVENVTADHEFYTYTCKVFKDGGETFVGEFRCDFRVVLIDVHPNVAHVKVGDTITLSATIDKNDRDDWRDKYNVGWQVDKGDGNGWAFIDYFRPRKDYELTIDSEEMLNWKYRAHLYQLIKPIDEPSLPEYDSFEITLRARGTPSVGSLSVPDYEISGEKGFITATLNGAYTSATTVYWEYSEDDGKSWTTISNHPNLSFMNQGFNIVGGGRSWMPSYFMSTLIVEYTNSLDGLKVRCVIDDFQEE